MTISFEKVTCQHIDTIYKWLQKEHIQQYWDNSQAYKDDILNFISGRIESSTYYNGVFKYWIGLEGDEPFALIMTSLFEDWGHSLSKYGKTITLDFAIGNLNYLGIGKASLTLEAFMSFYKIYIDQTVNTFFIDPDKENSKAVHVYQKAGFSKKGSYKVIEGYFKDRTHLIMVKRIS